MAHFAAVSRPGYPANRLLTELPALASRMTTRGTGDAHAASKTLVFLVDAQTPPVSSTDIRRRLASGESIRGLVPAAVETYVHQHGLYASHAQPHPQAADHLHD
jgi:nicotinate-nucleotide adenylyltransferase